MITSVFAQNRSATLAQTTKKSTGETFKVVNFDASDTINEDDTYYVEFTVKKDYPQLQDIYIDLDTVSGSPHGVITVYGKKFAGSTYASIGSAITFYGSADTTLTYSVTDVNRYRFYKVEIVANSTDQQSLVTDMRFKTWFANSVSTTDYTLSGDLIVGGTVTVAGETTLNDHLNMGAGDDIVGSTTSDINFGSDNFTVAGASGNTVTKGTLDVTGAGAFSTNLAVDGTSNLDDTDIDGTFTMDGTAFDVNSTTTVTIDNTNTSNGVVINAVTSASPVSIGHTTSETTVNDNLTVTGDADVVGAFTANTIASDGALSGAAITGTSVISPLYDATGAVGITIGSEDITALTFSGISEDLLWTPSTNTWTLSTSTGVTAIAVGGLNLTGVGTIGSGKISSTGGISLTANVTQFTVLTTLTATEIIGTDAGDLGHADGAILVAAPAGGTVLQFVSAMLIYDYASAAYTDGGNDLVINIGSTGAQLAVVKTIASSFLLGASADKMYTPYVEYSGGVGLPVLAGEALSLKSTAWTQPSTAAGVLRCYVTYNVITTGL